MRRRLQMGCGERLKCAARARVESPSGMRGRQAAPTAPPPPKAPERGGGRSPW
jgi:hypothetical protein